MPRRSRLHIPQHHSRPGEEPDFSYLETSPAGAVPRPDVNARVRDIGNLAIEMVRVLDDIEGGGIPFGVPVPVWRQASEMADQLADALVGNDFPDEQAAQEIAQRLFVTLRPHV
jgi:hypothetical protein